MEIETLKSIFDYFDKEITSLEGKEKLNTLKNFCRDYIGDESLVIVNVPTISEEEYNFLCNVDRDNYDVIKRYGFQVFLSKKNLVNVTCNVTKLFGKQWFQCLEMNQEYDIKLLLDVYDLSLI